MSASKDTKHPSERMPRAWLVGVILLGVLSVGLGLWLLISDATEPSPPKTPQRALPAEASSWDDRIDVLARNRQWDRLLEVAREIPAEHYSLMVMHDVQRALFHSGRLLSEMFMVPQTIKRDGRLGLSSLAPHTPRAAWKRAEVLFELGLVNAAESWAFVTLEVGGPRNNCLRLLSKVYVLKRHPVMVHTCLNALVAGDASERAWADARLKRLEADPLLSDDEEISHLRAMMPVKDYCRGPGTIAFRDYLLQLLDTNPRNRMALEYLIAFDLWSRHPEFVVADLVWWKHAGRTDMPRYCQEALLVFLSDPSYRKPKNRPLLAFARSCAPDIDETTHMLFREYATSLKKFIDTPADERASLQATMEKAYGTDYLFYDTFGYSASGKDVQPVDGVTGASK